ncbi:MAG: thioredoxin [Candidatus Margulisiibacteriota bacterium]
MMDVNSQNFEQEVLKQGLPVLVDFWAPWCGPCQAAAPVLKKIADEYAGKLKVVKVNTDEVPEVPAEYGIMSIPTLILFKGGKEIERVIGFNPGKIEEMIKRGVS